MEPEGSSPHSQAHATCPYSEPAPSSPHTHIPLPEDPSQYYPPIYAWVSPVVSFPQVSPPKPCTNLSPPPYALHAPPISYSITYFLLLLLIYHLFYAPRLLSQMHPTVTLASFYTNKISCVFC